ncbi:MAG: hypothetical protein ACK4UJ_02150 [Leptonema sp. (in: bacteria)]
MSYFVELNKFFRSPIFSIPIGIIFFLEIFLRTGIYNNFLKPMSYAANILRIQKVIQTSPIEPKVLIVGTSVPYQGLLLDQLNEYGKAKKLVFQSIATQGAFLDTQTMLLQYTLQKKKSIQFIVHFADLDFPWQQSYQLELSNRTMLAQFPIQEVIPLLKKNQYHLSDADYRFFYIKILTYQNDLRNFLLDPFGRIKSIARNKKNWNPNYNYINTQYYAISAYGTTIEECKRNAYYGIPFYKEGKQITDEPHRRAVLDTCKMAEYDPSLELGRNTWESLFFLRLSNFYQLALQNQKKLIVIIPPYSILMVNARKKEKVDFWIKTIEKIHKEIPIINLQFVLDDKQNLDYYYDTIHLNRKGAEKFTKIFFDSILPYAKIY